MNTLPESVLFEKYADQGFFWEGELPLVRFTRLSQEALSPEDTTLWLSCRLVKKDGLPWLSFVVKGEMQMQCQRCLSPLLYPVAGEYDTAVLSHEGQAQALDGKDYVLLSECGDGRQLPILILLEDELLLDLPLALTHEDCQALTTQVGAFEPIQDNPFAALAVLKKN